MKLAATVSSTIFTKILSIGHLTTLRYDIVAKQSLRK
jgi:hypothetical protein